MLQDMQEGLRAARSRRPEAAFRTRARLTASAPPTTSCAARQPTASQSTAAPRKRVRPL